MSNTSESIDPQIHQAKTILLVEDDMYISEVLEQAITQETPYMVALAQDANEALSIVKSIKPSLFILDYHLPIMDGIKLYDKLSSMPEMKGIPVLMMSAHLPITELRKRNIKGMNKPLDLDEFLQTIEDFLA